MHANETEAPDSMLLSKHIQCIYGTKINNSPIHMPPRTAVINNTSNQNVL